MKIARTNLINCLIYLIIVLIFVFLGREITVNWQEIKQYNFTLRYDYFILSVVVLSFSFLGLAYIWRLILLKIEPKANISFLPAFRLYIYSEFGKYLPGKIWAVLGRVYLGTRHGVSKTPLFISSFLDSVLAVLGMLTLGLIMLSIFFGYLTPWLYLFSVNILIFDLIIIHPKIFYPLINKVLDRLKKVKIDSSQYLSLRNIAVFYLLYCLVAFSYGLAFYLLVQSITLISLSALPGVIGAYLLATSLGVVALFAPSGLGIREGLLVMLLQLYLPLSIAVLISFIARLWFTLTEVGLLGIAGILNARK